MLYGIALGSNLGSRLENLQRGVALLLERLPAKVTAQAPVYETAPVDCGPEAESFLNSVIEIETALEPHELHSHLKRIENDLGRPEKRGRNAPRTLDLDILYAGALQIADETLTIPHPRLHERRFVLQPLADIRPNLLLPGRSQNVGDLLNALPPSSEVNRISGTILESEVIL